MELIKKVSDDLYIVRLDHAACVVDEIGYKKLCRFYNSKSK